MIIFTLKLKASPSISPLSCYISYFFIDILDCFRDEEAESSSFSLLSDEIICEWDLAEDPDKLNALVFYLVATFSSRDFCNEPSRNLPLDFISESLRRSWHFWPLSSVGILLFKENSFLVLISKLLLSRNRGPRSVSSVEILILFIIAEVLPLFWLILRLLFFNFKREWNINLNPIWKSSDILDSRIPQDIL